MKRIKYFSETFNKIEKVMNDYIENMCELNNTFDIISVHINQEINVDGCYCVNGYILYSI